ncbi:MAG: AMP-binding protein [Gammaproteobacteria bacterium]|jgi:long-chain acyl-CoA synthetase|nr:AMP-binding protein [Gammaproteobacteria bacterium]MBT5602249.1 AMP-binding protein [Gammaproteobacteria bacterium]
MTAFASELASDRPNEIALRDPLQELTWGEINDILNRAANALQSLDLGEHRRIAVFAENAVETALANLAGLISGASVVPVNFHLSAEEVAYILNDADVRLLFVGPETGLRGLQAAGMSVVDTVIGWRCEAELQTVDWLDWLADSSSQEPDDRVKPRPNLLYTSGTTGRPKGTHLPPTMFAGGDTIAEHLDNLKANPQASPGPHLVVGPMYHTGPLSGARLLAAGTPSVILTKFDAEKTLAAISTFQTTSTVMVPTHFVRLLALPEATKGKYDVSSMIRVSHTGSKCPVDVKHAMINWWGPVFLDAYGASEVGTTCMITSEEWLNHPGSVGRSIPPFTAIILDEDDNEVPANTEGRLFFKDATGRGVIYHNDPAKSAAAHIAPGVFTLGEIAYMDEENYVYITDRFSDMIVSGGVNIYPAEAEQILIQHPQVLDVACISIPHSEMGEELKALVILDSNTGQGDEDDIIAFCRARLSHFKCPRSIDFVTDLGRNTMGKINKRKLRSPYWETQGS